MLIVHSDYLQGVGIFPDLEDLTQFLDLICTDTGDNFVLLPKKRFWSGESFDNSFKSHCGACGGYSLVASGVRFLLVLPGRFLSQLSPDRHLQLFHRVASEENFRLTRLDIALDDYKRRVSWDFLVELLERGDYALCEKAQQTASKSSYLSEFEGSIYFGSPTSTKMLRFYNAEAVHDIPADRWEVQFRRKRAELAFSEVCLTASDIMQCGTLVTGAIDFVESVTKTQYSFWRSIQSDLQLPPYPVPCGQAPPDIDRTISWIDRQVGPSLAMIRDAAGEDWEKFFNILCSEWRDRYTPFHTDTIKKGADQLWRAIS